MASITLGTKARDIPSGFVGICTCRCEYLSGVVRIGLQPLVDKDGKLDDVKWFDEPTCVAVDEGAQNGTSR